jgi:hypothetical protein
MTYEQDKTMRRLLAALMLLTVAIVAEADNAAAGVPGGWTRVYMASADGSVVVGGLASPGTRFAAPAAPLRAPIVGLSVVGRRSRPTGAPADDRYWLAGADGGVFAMNGADFFGSAAEIELHQAIVGIASTPTGLGYWLVGRDGGVFTFGDAAFHGSLAEMKLDAEIVGIAPSPSGDGSWLASADGGVFSFGDAVFAGSAKRLRLRAPVIAIAAPTIGPGYRLLAADGGVFAFGGATYEGRPRRSLGPLVPALLPACGDFGTYAAVTRQGVGWRTGFRCTNDTMTPAGPYVAADARRGYSAA